MKTENHSTTSLKARQNCIAVQLHLMSAVFKENVLQQKLYIKIVLKITLLLSYSAASNTVHINFHFLIKL